MGDSNADIHCNIIQCRKPLSLETQVKNPTAYCSTNAIHIDYMKKRPVSHHVRVRITNDSFSAINYGCF